MKANAHTPMNKREEKKQVNVTWNSRLGFQIGIVLSCLFVFFVMQTSFKTRTSIPPATSSYDLKEPALFTYQLDVEKPQPVAAVKREPVKPTVIPKPVKTDVFLVTDNLSNQPETPIPPSDAPIAQNPVGSVPQPTSPEPEGPKSIINVEHVPVYPGCEGLRTNAEKIDCLSSEINVFINKNFRKEILENLERNQVQKIYVQFKIDSKGVVTDVRANSNNERLKKEAQRVVANLPKMKPGRQGDKNVDVIYTVPIVFRIQ